MDTETTNRYTKGGRRRGKYRYAAPLGVFISLLSLVGVAAIVCGVVFGIRKATDTTALKEEMYYFLEPLMLYNPTPFDGIEEEEQDAFLNAAAYKISKAEQVRMLRENDENCQYAVDDQGRIVVSVEEIGFILDGGVGTETDAIAEIESRRPRITVSRSMTHRPLPVASSMGMLLSLVSLWVTRRGSRPSAMAAVSSSAVFSRLFSDEPKNCR